MNATDANIAALCHSLVATSDQSLKMSTHYLSTLDSDELTRLKLMFDKCSEQFYMEKLYRKISARVNRNIESLEKYIANHGDGEVITPTLVDLARAIVAGVVDDSNRRVNVCESGNIMSRSLKQSSPNPIENTREFKTYSRLFAIRQLLMNREKIDHNEVDVVLGYYSRTKIFQYLFFKGAHINFPDSITLIIFSYMWPMNLADDKLASFIFRIQNSSFTFNFCQLDTNRYGKGGKGGKDGKGGKGDKDDKDGKVDAHKKFDIDKKPEVKSTIGNGGLHKTYGLDDFSSSLALKLLYDYLGVDKFCYDEKCVYDSEERKVANYKEADVKDYKATENNETKTSKAAENKDYKAVEVKRNENKLDCGENEEGHEFRKKRRKKSPSRSRISIMPKESKSLVIDKPKNMDCVVDALHKDGYSTEMLEMMCYILLIPFVDEDFITWSSRSKC